jgi:alpha-mannosidase
VEELGRYLREGRISLAAGFANMHSGLIGEEEMNRLVYLAESYRRRFSIPIEVAIQNDVPGFSWAYPRVFAGSGVKYLITGLNLFIGGGNNFGVRHTPFYWKGPDGSRVLTFFTYDSYVEGHRWNLTRRVPIETLENTVPRRLAWLEQNGYPYDTYLLMASVGDNADPMHAFGVLEKVREWNRRHAELPMQMATPEMYFRYVLEKYGDKFEEFSGDASGHWELVKLGSPEVAARMRETAALLPAAEALHHIASLQKGGEHPSYDLADAWRELLVFHEHTAGAGAGWPGYYTRWQTDWSNAAHYAAAMSGYSNARQLFDKGIARLTGTTGIFDPAQQASAEEAKVIVYNGLSWTRGGPVEIDKLPLSVAQHSLQVVDEVTKERLTVENVPGTSHVMFFAPSVPSMGYKLFTLRKSDSRPAARGAFQIATKVDDQGWIRSLQHANGTELVRDQQDRPFGSLLFSDRNAPYKVVPLGAAKVVHEAGPVRQRTEIVRENSPLVRTVAVGYRDAPYVDVSFSVNLRSFADRQGRIAIALPLETSEQLWLDGAGFVYRAQQDMLPGGMAPQLATISFVHSGQAGAPGRTIATRDAALLIRDGNFLVASQGLRTETRDEGVQTLDRTEPRGAEVQTFRFRIAAQNGDAANWKRFGQEFNLPLQASVFTSADLEPQQSFLRSSEPNVIIGAFKAAEDNSGWSVIRLQEIAGKSATHVRVESAFKAHEAVYANTVEAPTKIKADLNGIDLKPWQTVTILARLEKR